MLIDCDECPVRGEACAECVVTVLLGLPEQVPLEFDSSEQIAIARLAQAGLVPPLQPAIRPSIRPSVRSGARSASSVSGAARPHSGRAARESA